MAPPSLPTGLIIVALLGASCRGAPNETLPAVEAIAASPSSARGVFLEVGDGQTSEAGTPAHASAAQAPRSLDRWEWALRADGPTLTVYTDPDNVGSKRRTTIESSNPYGQSIAFPVRSVRMEGDEAWYRVLLGVEPNGSSGWVRGDEVTFERIRHRVIIDLSSRVLRHYRHGKLVHRFPVGIGARGTPTTAGRFFVWAHVEPRDPTGPYGSYLLGLSGFSEVLSDWPGGGRMAIHGTTDAGDPGVRVSFGCTRVYNPQMRLLRRIPMGTTVLIRR